MCRQAGRGLAGLLGLFLPAASFSGQRRPEGRRDPYCHGLAFDTLAISTAHYESGRLRHNLSRATGALPCGQIQRNERQVDTLAELVDSGVAEEASALLGAMMLSVIYKTTVNLQAKST